MFVNIDSASPFRVVLLVTFFRMEFPIIRSLSFPEIEVDLNVDPIKNLVEKSEFSVKCVRSETPLSDASTSGVCSLASSDFESSEENLNEQSKNQEEKFLSCPVSMHRLRNIIYFGGKKYIYIKQTPAKLN